MKIETLKRAFIAIIQAYSKRLGYNSITILFGKKDRTFGIISIISEK